MPLDVNQVVQVGTAVEPLILMIITAIKAHMAASNGQFPTPEQIQAALPADTQTLQGMWSAWSATHPSAGPSTAQLV